MQKKYSFHLWIKMGRKNGEMIEEKVGQSQQLRKENLKDEGETL